jgi:hypothetical protein
MKQFVKTVLFLIVLSVILLGIFLGYLWFTNIIVDFGAIVFKIFMAILGLAIVYRISSNLIKKA